MSLEKINKFIKKIHSKLSLENVNVNDLSLVKHNFGNVMICNNELNVSDELKNHFHYVRLPYNKNENPPKFKSTRFNFIKRTLTNSPITNWKELMVAISKYNCIEANEEYYFKNLQMYVSHFPEEAEIFFKEILPFIIEQALKLPEYITTSIPVMEKYMNIAYTFNKLQVLSLLANQFLCTFEEKTHDKYDTPMCSFLVLIGSMIALDSSVEKIRCVIHYFDKMRKRDLESLKSELITFQRISLERNNLPDWPNFKTNICEFTMDVDRTIEDCNNMLQLSCGNSYIGGSVLINRCFLEEIRFAICPELFISMIFTQKLDYMESVAVMGVERFSNYTGWDDGFKFVGDYNDETPIDDSNKRATEIVAINPHYYSNSEYYDQFSKKEILRELNKLYSGFKENDLSSLKKESYIATTHWGSTIYNGNIELTTMLQILAASVAGRNINYCSCICGGYKSLHNIEEFMEQLKKNNITTDKLYRYIRSYRHDIIVNVTKDNPPECTLMNYILNRIKNHHRHHKKPQTNNESENNIDNDNDNSEDNINNYNDNSEENISNENRNVDGSDENINDDDKTEGNIEESKPDIVKDSNPNINDDNTEKNISRKKDDKVDSDETNEHNKNDIYKNNNNEYEEKDNKNDINKNNSNENEEKDDKNGISENNNNENEEKDNKI